MSFDKFIYRKLSVDIIVFVIFFFSKLCPFSARRGTMKLTPRSMLLWQVPEMCGRQTCRAGELSR